MTKLTKMKINCPVCSKELWVQNLKNHIECVHKKNKGYYILDLAFYFMKPIFIYNKYLEKKRYGSSKNIYDNNILEKMSFVSNILLEDQILNEFQTIPKNTIMCTVNYIKDKYDIEFYINGFKSYNFNYQNTQFESQNINLISGRNTFRIIGKNNSGTDEDQTIIYYNKSNK